MGRATAGVRGGETTRRMEIHHGGEVQVVVTADRKETYSQIATLSIANRKTEGRTAHGQVANTAKFDNRRSQRYLPANRKETSAPSQNWARLWDGWER